MIWNLKYSFKNFKNLFIHVKRRNHITKFYSENRIQVTDAKLTESESPLSKWSILVFKSFFGKAHFPMHESKCQYQFDLNKVRLRNKNNQRFIKILFSLYRINSWTWNNIYFHYCIKNDYFIRKERKKDFGRKRKWKRFILHKISFPKCSATQVHRL